MSTPAPASAPLPAVALVLGSCASLQAGAALATQLFPYAGSWGVTFVRLAIAAVFLVVVAPPTKARSWSARTWRSVAVYGASLGLMNAFFYASIARIPLGVAVTIEFLGPLLLSAALSKNARDYLWVGLAVAGMGLLGLNSLTTAATSHPGGAATSLDPIGVACALVAAAFWTVYILASKRVGSTVPGASGLAVAMVVGALVIAPVGAPRSLVLFSDATTAALALGTALLASVLPYSLELAALRSLPPAIFGILLSLEPVFAALAGLLFLGQELGALPTAAIALVVCASIGTTMSNRPAGGRRVKRTRSVPRRPTVERRT